MKLEKINQPDLPDDVDVLVDKTLFSAPVRVQGADKRVFRNMLLIDSEKRYKLFTESTDFVFILGGKGFIKWKRGETAFSEGDLFRLEQTGEYELNGACRFLVVRK